MPDIYCPDHRKNEHLTVTELIDLVHGLNADLIDEQCESTESREGEQGCIAVYDFCPTRSLRTYRDTEMYYEHLQAMNECRLAVAKATEVGR